MPQGVVYALGSTLGFTHWFYTLVQPRLADAHRFRFRLTMEPSFFYLLGESYFMIAHLRGILLEKHPNQAVVECSGVGYDVVITVPTFSALPEEGTSIALHIHTHVREDALALFGFGARDEKHLFEKLITVSGIGPKLAVTILSGMASDALGAAIRSNDLAALTRIPGIGKKTAERMVLELRDKIPPPAASAEVVAASATPAEEDALSALLNLGYQRATAERALAGVKVGRDSFDTLFREALASLSK